MMMMMVMGNNDNYRERLIYRAAHLHFCLCSVSDKHQLIDTSGISVR